MYEGELLLKKDMALSAEGGESVITGSKNRSIEVIKKSQFFIKNFQEAI